MLDPLLLRSFVAIIDTGSFTRAGERVHLTQSTISQQIRRLEQQLGCPLLDRAGRQVVATEEGEKLLGLARRILALLAQAEEQVSEGSVSLSLGVPEDFAAGAITPVLAAFARDYPEVRLEVESGLSHHIWQRFAAGELDLALVKQVRGQGSPLASWLEPLVWVDSRDWPAKGRDPLPYRLCQRQSRQFAGGGERGYRGELAAQTADARRSAGPDPVAQGGIGGAGAPCGKGGGRAAQPLEFGPDRPL